MRGSAWPFLAALSLLPVATAGAATRPRYGGTLRIEMHSAVDSLETKSRLLELTSDTLVRLDAQGRPQPALAKSWSLDAEFKRWRFTLRKGVTLHDGSPLTALQAAAALQSAGGGRTIGADRDEVIVEAAQPMPDLLLELARASHGIPGAGAFRTGNWQPGQRVTLTANENYWGGRPFVDAIDIQTARSFREQSVDLDLGKADIIEVPANETRRFLQRAPQNGSRLWSSLPVEALALVFDRVEDQRIREAISLSIDRAAIYNVLLQKQGEISGALLPQWLSGYALLFPGVFDLTRARQLASGLPKSAHKLTLGYDAADALARTVAERIAVDAHEAGIVLQPSPAPLPEIRLVRVRIDSIDAGQALSGIAVSLGAAHPSENSTPEALYAAERALLGGFRIVPLFHLPELYGLSARVRDWMPARWDVWHLADVWLESGKP